MVLVQGGHKVAEKNSPSFPGFSRAINLLFHRLSQQKVNVIMTFIKGRVATPWDPNDPVYPVNSCFSQIFEWRTKNTLLQFFPEVAQNSQEFPEFSMLREIPEYSRFSRFVATLWLLWVQTDCTASLCHSILTATWNDKPAVQSTYVAVVATYTEFHSSYLSASFHSFLTLTLSPAITILNLN